MKVYNIYLKHFNEMTWKASDIVLILKTDTLYNYMLWLSDYMNNLIAVFIDSL